MARPTKYKKKYAKELLEGIRRNPDVSTSGREYGWSIQRLCWRWGITEKTYYNWIAEFTSFKEAHEAGERDFQVYWQEKIEDACHDKNMNGGVVKFAAANTIGWTDKKEVTQNTTENKIHKIEIEVIAPQPVQVPQIEQKPSNIIDITPIYEHDKIKSS